MKSYSLKIQRYVSIPQQSPHFAFTLIPTYLCKHLRVTQVRCSETMTIVKCLHQENLFPGAERWLLKKPSPNAQLAGGLSRNAIPWDSQKAVLLCTCLPITFSRMPRPKLKLHPTRIFHECLMPPVPPGSGLLLLEHTRVCTSLRGWQIYLHARPRHQDPHMPHCLLLLILGPTNSQSSCLIFVVG